MAKISEKKLFTSVVIITMILVCTVATIFSFLPIPSFTRGEMENGRKLIQKARKNLNLTKILHEAQNYNIAYSLLLASGFLKELEGFNGRSGITLFMPIDYSFVELPESVNIPSLWSDKKTLLIKGHVCRGYYRFASLESAMQENLPTFATDSTAAELYTLNISGVAGVVTVSTGIVEAKMIQILYDRKPIVIYGVSKVLLPKEIFGNKPIVFDRFV